MRFSLSLLATVLFGLTVSAALPIQNQGLLVNSGLPCRDGLVLWLSPWSGYWTDDGITPATRSSLVKQWNDISGHGFHANSGTTNNALLLDSQWNINSPISGTGYYTTGTNFVINMTNYTLMVMCRSYSIFEGGNQSPITFTGQSPTIMGAYNNIIPNAYVGGVVHSHTNIASIDAQVFALTGDSSGHKYYVGGPSISFAASSGTATNATIGAWPSTGPYNGELFQYLVWNRALSATEVSAVTAWLHGFQPFHTNYLRRIVCNGDSITSGVGTTDVGTWPYQLQQLQGNTSQVYSSALHGLQVPNMIAEAPTTITPIYKSGMTNFSLLLGGVNDILQSGASGPTVFSNLVSYAAARAATGFKSIGMTVTPVALAGWTATMESNRVALNNLILANPTNWTAIVNYADDARLTNPSNTVYFYDGIHLTTVGNGVLASLVNTVLSGL